jgi:predicted RNA methylase
MKLKELNSALSSVRPFDTSLQKVELEQYPTGAHLASRLVFTAATSFDDVEDRVVVDLGTGTGMLGIGCVMMGASRVVGIDADPDALAVAQANIDDIGVDEEMELLLADVGSLPLRRRRRKQQQQQQQQQSGTSGEEEGIGRVGGGGGGGGGDGGDSDDVEPWVDTVVMNPPFGTRNKGVDVLFLEQALSLRPRAIYSLHKTSTREFLLNKARSEWGLHAEVLAEMRFDVPNMYKFHKKKSKDIAVDFLRFEVPDEVRFAADRGDGLPGVREGDEGVEGAAAAGGDAGDAGGASSQQEGVRAEEGAGRSSEPPTCPASLTAIPVQPPPPGGRAAAATAPHAPA